MRKLKDLRLKSKRVLVRCDFNVPLKKGKILDDYRIRMTIPTIEYLIKKKAKVILMSHLGRPEKRERKYSLRPVAKRLEDLLKRKVKFLKDCIGESVKKEIEKMKEGEIFLLENLRFHKEEEANSKNFAKKLALLGDIFIQDAFSCCHRYHASIVLLPKLLPSAAGFLLEKEISALSRLLKKIKRPLVAIIGGIKFLTKMGAIEYFCKEADFTLLGGHIANILLAAKGKKMGTLFPDGEQVREIKKTILFSAKVHLPKDFVVWPSLKIKKLGEIEKKERAFDIGPETIENFSKIIGKAKTIFWNGPMGVYEKTPFEKGTEKIARAIFENPTAFEVVGGGDTVSAISKFGFLKRYDHVSTGGGAMLDFLAKKSLPGLEALK